jgi:hypothetical protein
VHPVHRSVSRAWPIAVVALALSRYSAYVCDVDAQRRCRRTHR